MREKETGLRPGRVGRHAALVAAASVAMTGGSYDGTTATAAAVEPPKGLATIVPEAAIGRWYDYAYSSRACATS